jgi:hypothetical protein
VGSGLESLKTADRMLVSRLNFLIQYIQLHGGVVQRAQNWEKSSSLFEECFALVSCMNHSIFLEGNME